MKKILVVDGGGALGVIPLAILKEIEKTLNQPSNEIFSLITGTSVGAIISGALSISESTAAYVLNSFMDALPKIFCYKPHIPIAQSKYRREDVVNFLKDYIPLDAKMNTCQTKFMCTSVNMVDAKTHYFKSFEEKDGNLNLIEAINRSYAAPYYFGSIIDSKNSAVWVDGGCGNQNCPLIESYIEILRQGWINERVHILSLGTGQTNESTPFNKAKFYKAVREILFFMQPTEGGLARVQSIGTQVELVKSECLAHPNITFQRLDILDMPKKLNKLDGSNYRYIYKRWGEDLAKEVNYNLFKE